MTEISTNDHDRRQTDKRPTTEFKKAKLLEQIKSSNLSKTAIFIGNVDPDGLASGAAMEAILQKWGFNPTIFYKGTFNRPANKTFKTQLNLNVQPEENFNEEDSYTCIISVDAPATLCPVQPDFIIDHHEIAGGNARIGSDIRMIGATSSILWEYLLAAEINFTDEQGARLAAALAFGIKTDTKDGTVESISDLDFEALAFCLKHKDNKIYKAILNAPKPSYYNDFYVIGWNNRKIEGSILVTGLGNIPEQRSGVISDIAEQFSSTDGISTAVAFGVVEGSIDISVRSSNSSLDVGEFVRTFANGGGKLGAARAKIELPLLFQDLPEDLSTKFFDIINEIVKHKCLQIAGDRK